MAREGIWTGLENAYYSIIDRIDPQGRHIGKVIYGIEEKGVPTLPLLLAVVLLLASIPLINYALSPKLHEVTILAANGTPVANTTVYLCGQEFQTDDRGKISLESDPCKESSARYIYADGFEGKTFSKIPRKILLQPIEKHITIDVAGAVNTPIIRVITDVNEVNIYAYSTEICYAPVPSSKCIEARSHIRILATDGKAWAEYNIDSPYWDAPENVTLFLETESADAGTLQIRTNIDDGIAYIYDPSDYLNPIVTVPIMGGNGETSLPPGDYVVLLVPYKKDGTPITSKDYSYKVRIEPQKTTLLAKDLEIPKKTEDLAITPGKTVHVRTEDGYIPVPVSSSSGKAAVASPSDVKIVETAAPKEEENLYTLTVEAIRWEHPTDATVIVRAANEIVVSSGSTRDGVFTAVLPEGKYEATVRAGAVEKGVQIDLHKDMTTKVDLSTWAKATFILSGNYERVRTAEIRAKIPPFHKTLVLDGQSSFEANIPTDTVLEITLKDANGNIIYQNRKTISAGKETIYFSNDQPEVTVAIYVPQEINGISFIGVFDDSGNRIDLDNNDPIVIDKNYELRIAFSMPKAYRKPGAGCIVEFKGESLVKTGKYSRSTNGIRPIEAYTNIVPIDEELAVVDNIKIPITSRAETFQGWPTHGNDAYLIIPYSICSNDDCAGIVTYKFAGRYVVGVKLAELGYRIVCLRDLDITKYNKKYQTYLEAAKNKPDLLKRIYINLAKQEGTKIQQKVWRLPIITEEPIVEGSARFVDRLWMPCKQQEDLNTELIEELQRHKVHPVRGWISWESHTKIGAPVEFSSTDAYILRVCKAVDTEKHIVAENSNEILDFMRKVIYRVDFLPKSRKQATFHITVKSTTPAASGSRIELSETIEAPMKPWYNTYEDLVYRKSIDKISKEAIRYYGESSPPFNKFLKKRPMKIGDWYRIQFDVYVPVKRFSLNQSTILKGEINVIGAVATYDAKIQEPGLVKRAPAVVNKSVRYKITLFVKPTGETNTVKITFNGDGCVADYNVTQIRRCVPREKTLEFPVETPKLDVNAMATKGNNSIDLLIHVKDAITGKPVPATVTILLPGGRKKTVCYKYEIIEKRGRNGEKKYKKCVVWGQIVEKNKKTGVTDKNGFATFHVSKSLAGKEVKYTVIAPGHLPANEIITLPEIPVETNQASETNEPEKITPNINVCFNKADGTAHVSVYLPPPDNYRKGTYMQTLARVYILDDKEKQIGYGAGTVTGDKPVDVTVQINPDHINEATKMHLKYEISRSGAGGGSYKGTTEITYTECPKSVNGNYQEIRVNGITIRYRAAKMPTEHGVWHPAIVTVESNTPITEYSGTLQIRIDDIAVDPADANVEDLFRVRVYPPGYGSANVGKVRYNPEQNTIMIYARYTVSRQTDRIPLEVLAGDVIIGRVDVPAEISAVPKSIEINGVRIKYFPDRITVDKDLIDLNAGETNGTIRVTVHDVVIDPADANLSRIIRLHSPSNQQWLRVSTKSVEYNPKSKEVKITGQYTVVKTAYDGQRSAKIFVYAYMGAHTAITMGAVSLTIVPGAKTEREHIEKKIAETVEQNVYAEIVEQNDPKEVNITMIVAKRHPSCWYECTIVNGEKSCKQQCSYTFRATPDDAEIRYVIKIENIPEDVPEEDIVDIIHKVVRAPGVRVEENVIASEGNTYDYRAEYLLPISALIRAQIRPIVDGNGIVIKIPIYTPRRMHIVRNGQISREIIYVKVKELKIRPSTPLNMLVVFGPKCGPADDSTPGEPKIECRYPMMAYRFTGETVSEYPYELDPQGITATLSATYSRKWSTTGKIAVEENQIVAEFDLNGAPLYVKYEAIELHKGHTQVKNLQVWLISNAQRNITLELNVLGVKNVKTWGPKYAETLIIPRILAFSASEVTITPTTQIELNILPAQPIDEFAKASDYKTILVRGCGGLEDAYDARRLSAGNIYAVLEKNIPWLKTATMPMILYVVGDTIYTGMPLEICADRSTLVQVVSDLEDLQSATEAISEARHEYEQAEAEVTLSKAKPACYIYYPGRVKKFRVVVDSHPYHALKLSAGCITIPWKPTREDFNTIYIVEMVHIVGKYIPVIAQIGEGNLQNLEENRPEIQVSKIPGSELIPPVDGPYYAHTDHIGYDPRSDRPEYQFCSDYLCNWEGIANAIYRMAEDGVNSAELLFSPGPTPMNYRTSTTVQLSREMYDLGKVSSGYGIVVKIRDRTFCVEDWPAYYIFTSVPGLKFTPGFAGTPVPAEMNVYVYPAGAQEVKDTFGRDLSGNCDYVVWVNGQGSIKAPSGYDYYGIMMAKGVGYTLEDLPEDVRALTEKYPMELFYWVDEENKVHGGYVKNCVVTGEDILDNYAEIYVWGVGKISKDEYVEKYKGLPYWVWDVPQCTADNSIEIHRIDGIAGYVSSKTLSELGVMAR